MKINEVILTEQQIILNELSWNDVKKAIVGGVISLTALGVTDVNAQDISQMSPDEVKQELLQKLDAGERQELIKALQNADSMSDTNATVSSSDNPNQSQFKINNIRLGMSLDELVAATGVGKFDKHKFWQDTHKKNITKAENPALYYMKINAINSPDFLPGGKYYKTLEPYLEKPKNLDQALARYPIAGMTGWWVNGKDSVESLTRYIQPEEWVIAVNKFQKLYGAPEMSKFRVKNKMGWEGTNHVATWDIDDVKITIKTYGPKITNGMIQIEKK